ASPTPSPVSNSAPTPTPAPSPAPMPSTMSRVQVQTAAASAYQDIGVVAGWDITGLSNYLDYYQKFHGGNAITACTSGTATVAVVDGGTAGVPDNGDSLTITYSDCVLNGGVSIKNGVENVSFTSATGDPTQAPFSWDAQYIISYQNLEV